MILAVVKEIWVGSAVWRRSQEEVRKYKRYGVRSSGRGRTLVLASIGGEEYVQAGAEVVSNPEELWDRADVVIKVKQPVFNDKVGKHEAEMVRPGATLITFLHRRPPITTR